MESVTTLAWNTGVLGEWQWIIDSARNARSRHLINGSMYYRNSANLGMPEEQEMLGFLPPCFFTGMKHVTNPSCHSHWAPPVCQALSWEANMKTRCERSSWGRHRETKQNTELNDATAERICDGIDWAYTDFQKQPTGISQVQVTHALHRGCSHPEEREKTTHMQAQELAVVGANKSEGHKRLERWTAKVQPPDASGRPRKDFQQWNDAIGSAFWKHVSGWW